MIKLYFSPGEGPDIIFLIMQHKVNYILCYFNCAILKLWSITVASQFYHVIRCTIKFVNFKKKIAETELKRASYELKKALFTHRVFYLYSARIEISIEFFPFFSKFLNTHTHVYQRQRDITHEPIFSSNPLIVSPQFNQKMGFYIWD